MLMNPVENLPKSYALHRLTTKSWIAIFEFFFVRADLYMAWIIKRKILSVIVNTENAYLLRIHEMIFDLSMMDIV